jgi:fructose-1,6-bisphosphatase I
MIIEQAGGTSIDCELRRILDLEPKELHERCTVVMGSPLMVKEMKEFILKYSAPK